MSTRPRTLTRQTSRFSQEGLFFHALLGLVVVGRRIDRLIAFVEQSAATPGPAVEPLDEPEVAHTGLESAAYLLLGIHSFARRVTRFVQAIAPELAVPERTPPAPRNSESLLR